MKKIAFLIIFVLSSSVVSCSDTSSDTSLETFLELFFDSQNFRNKYYNIGGREMLFCFLYRPSPNIHRPSTNIFYKGIILDKAHPFTPLLYISENKIISPSGNIILEAIALPRVFYGWSIRVFEGTNTFSLNPFWDNGKDTTDHINFAWDSTNRKFRYDPPDRSQW